jgi:hypothetical protein
VITERVSRRWLAGLGLLAAALVTTLYWPSLQFDLYADDFVSLRPWFPDAYWRSLTGSWLEFPDAPGFYRPVTTTYYAIAFYVFGLNAAPLHVLPLVVVPLSGWLAGVYVWRETRSRAAAMTVTVVYVLHPATTMSVGPWIANQYHGFATICVLVTLILWQRCRERPLRAWAPLLLPIVLAGFTKEDALMLPLVLVTAQWAIARWTGTVAAPTRPVVLAAIGVFVAMNLWRVVMLGGPGGYWMPELRDLILNAIRGPVYVLLVQLRAPAWAEAASAASLLCLLAAARVVYVHRAAPLTRVAVVGIVLLVLANAPLVLMTSRERGYLLVLAASLMMTVGLVALVRWLVRVGGPWAAATMIVMVAAVFAATSVNRLQMFGPCSPDSRLGDQWLQQDMVPYLPPEMDEWLEQRITSCDPATYRPIVESLPAATWSHAGGATMLVRDSARTVQVHARVMGSVAASLRVSVNGRALPPVTVAPGEWMHFEVPLDGSWLTPLRRSHRLDVRSDVPVEIRSGDVIN